MDCFILRTRTICAATLGGTSCVPLAHSTLTQIRIS